MALRVHVLPVLSEISLVGLKASPIQRLYHQKLVEGLGSKSIKNILGCLHMKVSRWIPDDPGF